VIKLVRGWFGRWRVFRIGHTEGDEFWLATFRHCEHAEAFVELLTGERPK